LELQQTVAVAVLTTQQDDVEIINSTLRGSGIAAHCQWIDSPRKFDQALASGSIDIIILNCDTYGDSLLQVVGQKDSYAPEVPVIAASQQVDETRIQEALETGARDLVSLDNRARIQRVVARELRTYRVERALNSTINSATEYRKQLGVYMQCSASAIAHVREGIVVEANKVWMSLFKTNDDSEICGMPLMDNFDSGSQAAIKGAIVATMKGKWQAGEKLLATVKLDGQEETELEMSFQLINFGDGAQVQIRIAPLKQAPEESTVLVHEALQRDPTTLFFNRTTFLERIKRRLAKKPSSGMYALAYIKPDKFNTLKKDICILDTEEILSQFAEEVRKRMHPRDMAGRFEGTALMVLLHRGNERDSESWGKQLVEHIQEHSFSIGDQTVNLTCSVGVCAVSGVYSTLGELVTAVVKAHDKTRSGGGNAVQLGGSDDEDSRLRKYDAIWIKRIKAALNDSRFRLAQLPIAGLRSDSIRMFDMLVRMLDEQGNSVLPAEFVAPAERNNLMKLIDRWIFTASADYCRDQSVDRVFVRLSQQSIRDKNLNAWMERKPTVAKSIQRSLLCRFPSRMLQNSSRTPGGPCRGCATWESDLHSNTTEFKKTDTRSWTCSNPTTLRSMAS
jgi:diguanylate cyclase (GGDEF)-like protein